MKIKQLITRLLITSIFISNTNINSLASTLSKDDRYEEFKGEYLTIDNVIGNDKVEVEIEGNSLLNLADNSNGWTLNTYNNTIAFNHIDAKLLKPNTDYTIVFIGDMSNIRSSSTILQNVTEGNNDVIGRSSSNKYKYKVRTNSLIHNGASHPIYIIPHIYPYEGDVFTQDELDNLDLKVMIFEGDLTDVETPIEYFEGIKSVGELENNILSVVSHNKNLWDGRYELGSIYTGEDDCYPGEDSNLGINRKRSYYIPVKPDTTYTISQVGYLNIAESEIYIHQYDKYKQNILWKEGLSYKGVKEKLTFTTSSNTYYLRFRTQNNRELTPDTVMLEEGNIATNIIEQNNDKKIIQLKEPLRALPNGVKDKVIKRNNQWYIERNINEIKLQGDEKWRMYLRNENIDVLEFHMKLFPRAKGHDANLYQPSTLCDKFLVKHKYSNEEKVYTHASEASTLTLVISKDKLKTETEKGLSEWLKFNNVTLLYQLETPIYEPIEFNSLQLYLDTTHISNNSSIPATMEVTVDRTLNRAVEYTTLAKTNPTIENLSKARYWNNLLKDSIKKDQLQEEVNSITRLNDMELERKNVTSNLDLYIKCENILMMSLSTNNITFEDFSGVEDMEKVDAVQISINSSLPYSLNAYLPTEIQNSDKSVTMNKDILNIKESSENTYQTFSNTTDKVVLKDDCSGGNDLVHNIDIKLKGGIAHQKDVYKTTIKFEAEQK